MNKSAVFHRTSDNFCYALDKDNLVITIRTGLDITDVSICFGDPYTTGIMGG
ncbi:MAG: alpha amylase N-terminal ig-like domain-containing protein, partial [Lachnospiraceae bacterium]|nr:alpha amylase N-terminal ig-like domain-containing protein [Lachnospiraceae bacterium]